MNKFKKSISILLIFTMVLMTVVGCGAKGNVISEEETSAEGEQGADSNNVESEKESAYTGTIRWLNYKPETKEELEKLAELYTEKTGIKVEVETAASGAYYPTLTARLDTSEAPSIFILTDHVTTEEYQEYCMDLTDTELCSWVTDESCKQIVDGKVLAISECIEGWGIIVNTAIMEKYFESPNKKVEYTSVDDITNFKVLKAVVEDMTTMKDELGIKGVFGATSLGVGNAYRYSAHLISIPLFWEWGGNENIDFGGEIPEFSFAYAEQFKNLMDLYLNNSTIEPELVGTKSVDDSMAEFALGECAMVQNGDWGWNTIKNTEGIKISADDVAFITPCIGAEGEEAYGFGGGGTNNMAINATLPEEDRQAALDMLEWMFGSEEGVEYVSKTLQFVTPFSTFADAEYENPLQKSEATFVSKGKITYCWASDLIPSEIWKEDFGASLLMYAQGQKDWDAVVKDAVDEWAVERNIVLEQ